MDKDRRQFEQYRQTAQHCLDGLETLQRHADLYADLTEEQQAMLITPPDGTKSLTDFVNKARNTALLLLQKVYQSELLTSGDMHHMERLLTEINSLIRQVEIRH